MDVAHESQAKIAVAATLVEFIEDHTAHPWELWVDLQPPEKEACRYDFKARAAAALLLMANCITHLFANGFVELVSKS